MIRISRRYSPRSDEYSASRMLARVAAGTERGLMKALKCYHQAVVEEAPIKTGLLKNSIIYRFGVGNKNGSSAYYGLNSYGGGKKGAKVDKSAYDAVVEEGGFPTSNSPHMKSGFVGTFVSRSVAEGYKGDYSDSDTFQYAPYLEFGVANSAPNRFMERAMNKVKDEMHDDICAEISKELFT